MNREHVISDELLAIAHLAFLKNEHWIAYNTITYFLESNEMYFFKRSDEAHEFSDNNISEYDDYKVIYARSVDELLKQIPYAEKLSKELNDKRSVATEAATRNAEEKQNYQTKNLSTMNEKNYDYLSKQLRNTGFGEELNELLKEKMQKQEAQFTLTFQKDYGKDQTVSTLHFKKSEESDMYFYNRFSLMLQSEKHPDAIKQTFYVNPKADNTTLKEAYNLMSGRAIHKEMTNKEGEKYNAWLQIDFKETDANGNYKMKQFHQNYGYDLKAVLSSYPINELQSEQNKQRLMESLERGNRQSVTMDLGGKEVKVYIEASPQFKSLNLYDADMKRVTRQTLSEKNSEEQSQKQNLKQTSKQAVADDGDGPVESPKKTKRKRQSIS